MQLRFNNCKWSNLAAKRDRSPINMIIKRKKVADQTGRVEFVNCYVYDNVKRPFLRITDAGGGKGTYDVKGEINVHNPHGVKVNTGIRDEKLPLKVRVLSGKNR